MREVATSLPGSVEATQWRVVLLTGHCDTDSVARGRGAEDSGGGGGKVRHILLLSGKDSLATALVQTTRAPALPYEFLFCDVGAELPETYAWIDRVEDVTGWPIQRIGKSLKEASNRYGGYLPSPKVRYCTRECKIEPMQAYLKGSAARVYYGLRADENRTGYVPVAGSEIEPVYPLQELGIDLRGVYAILDAQNLMPPNFFWPRLHTAVCERMAGWGDWESTLSRMEHSILFAGRSRGNCSLCFFQQLPEWVWLMETHPDLFDEAKAFENVGSNYTWRPDYSLDEVAARAPEIFESKVKNVVKRIQRRLQLSMFEAEDNEIALTSCGLLCGK